MLPIGTKKQLNNLGGGFPPREEFKLGDFLDTLTPLSATGLIVFQPGGVASDVPVGTEKTGTASYVHVSHAKPQPLAAQRKLLQAVSPPSASGLVECYLPGFCLLPRHDQAANRTPDGVAVDVGQYYVM